MKLSGSELQFPNHHNYSIESFTSTWPNPKTSLNPNVLFLLQNFSTNIEEENLTQPSNDTNSSLTSQSTTITVITSVVVPIMIVFCLIAAVVNLIIALSARWCRRPMSPTLYISISLAIADAVAALTIGTGLFVFNFLKPRGIQVDFGLGHCLALGIEACRLSMILVTVAHLLALAVNHWIGIARPLHYAATMTRRVAWTLIILSWIFPFLCINAYFSWGHGFMSQLCKEWGFLKKRGYRIYFAGFFFAPLILMIFIYLHIYLIVRSHEQHRQRFQANLQSTQQLQRNVKAVVTTVLIFGTFIIGWMPGIVWSLLFCDNCLYTFKDIHQDVVYPIGCAINTLIILHCCADPIIYAARMADIKTALGKMRYAFLKFFCGKCIPSLRPPMETLERGMSMYTRTTTMESGLRTSFTSSTRRGHSSGRDSSHLSTDTGSSRDPIALPSNGLHSTRVKINGKDSTQQTQV